MKYLADAFSLVEKLKKQNIILDKTEVCLDYVTYHVLAHARLKLHNIEVGSSIRFDDYLICSLRERALDASIPVILAIGVSGNVVGQVIVVSYYRMQPCIVFADDEECLDYICEQNSYCYSIDSSKYYASEGIYVCTYDSGDSSDFSWKRAMQQLKDLVCKGDKK